MQFFVYTLVVTCAFAGLVHAESVISVSRHTEESCVSVCSGQVLAFSNTQSTIALKLSLFLTSFLVRFLTHFRILTSFV